MPEITLPKSSSTSSFVNFKSSDAASTSKPSEVMSFNFKSSDTSNIILKKKTQDNPDVVKPAAQLVTGSIDEIFSKKEEKQKPESTTNLLDKFKPAAGTWECSSCLLRNTPDTVKCAACETPKEKKAGASESTGFGKEFKMSSDKWECQECFVRNEGSVTKCVACTAPKPGSATTKAPPPPNGPASCSFKWGDQFKPPSSTWECPTCMIRNKDETEKCVACETPKPGGISKSKSSTTESSTNKVTEPKESIQKFNFGFFPNATANLPQTTQQSTTKSEEAKPSTTISSIFGQNSTTKSSVTTTITSSIPTFTFGIPSKNLEDKKVINEKKEETKEIVFKVPEKLPEKTETTTTTNTISGFVFGSTPIKPAEVTQPINTPQSQPEEKPAQTTIPTSFAFGATNNLSQPGNNTKADSTSQKIVTIPTTSTPLTGFTFAANASPSLKRPSNDNDLQPSMNAKKDAPTLPAAPIIFSPPKQPLINKADSNILSKTSLPLSNGNSNKVDNNNLFATITPAAAAAPTQTVPSNSFTFTPTQTQTVLPTTSTTTNLFNFGAKTTSMPIFGNTTTTTTTTAESSIFKFGPSSTTPSNQSGFGGINMQPPTNNLFGNSNATSSVFGAVNKPAFETPAVPATNAFGTAASASFPAPTSEIKPFAFGNPTNETLSQPKTSGFSFGQTPKPAEPAKPVFNFGAPTSSSTAPAGGGFSFNTNTNTAAPNMNFNFNPPKMDNPSPFQSSTVPASNIFSPQNPVQPAQPQPLQNGGFNFGGAPANNNTKTGFNFGVPATPPQFNQPQPPPSGVFSFGAPTQNP
ncbi:hypothetical protein ILUMI_17418, partial [Ignelater luminosus]